MTTHSHTHKHPVLTPYLAIEHTHDHEDPTLEHFNLEAKYLTAMRTRHEHLPSEG